MGHFSFWQKWLFVTGLLLALFGVTFALFGGTPLFEIFDTQINPVFWGSVEIPDLAAGEFQRWIYGVLGATIAGWGVFLAFIAHYPFKNREPWAWNCILTGIIVWYVLDTGISLYFRVYFNAVFNAVLLALVVIPLGFSRKHFGENQ
jgi:hypothetical protein